MPDFRLPDADGNEVALDDLRGQKVVVYFYPRDDTPGCTTQACTFRDQFEAFSDAGATVIGISDDDPETHKAFAERHQLPFKLLSDAGGKVRKRIGVPTTLGLIPGRVTYVIDQQGIVQHTFNSQMKAAQHVDEALQVLERLG